jgi:hypothetical protein
MKVDIRGHLRVHYFYAVYIKNLCLCVIVHSLTHCSNLGLYPSQFIEDLSWTEWYWEWFFAEFFRFSFSVSFHCCCTFIRVSPGGMDSGPSSSTISIESVVSPHCNNVNPKNA